jgi:hypothetical protein
VKIVLDVLFWLPVKLVAPVLRPVTAMLDSLAENAEAAVKEYVEQHPLS